MPAQEGSQSEENLIYFHSHTHDANIGGNARLVRNIVAFLENIFTFYNVVFFRLHEKLREMNHGNRTPVGVWTGKGLRVSQTK